MTVAELIQHLQQYDMQMPVMVNGYEGGFSDVLKERVYIKEIALNIHGLSAVDDGVYGIHERADQDYWVVDGAKIVKSLIMGRDEDY